LWYGKYEQDKEPELKMKLVIGFVDQMLEKDVVKVNEAETEIFKQPSKKYGFVSHLAKIEFLTQKYRRDDLLIDDNMSQSQSSNSSTSSSVQEQKTVRSFKEKIKEQQRPFFVRCFIKLGILISCSS
jgi:hypothetical protein